MATFNSDGSIEAAPAEEQLAPPPGLEPDPDADGGISVPAPLADKIDAETRPSVEDQVAATQPSEPETKAELAAVPDPEPEPDAEGPGTAIALAPRFDIAETEEVWPYDFLEFKGDKLGIRLPTRQALAAFSLASSKYVSLGVKNDLTGLFIARHLSPESYGRVFSRLMDPDENDYTVDTVGELFNAIVTAAVNADKALEKGDGSK